MVQPEISIVRADLWDEAQSEALVEIIDSYARGPGGQNAPLSERARARLASGLRDHPTSFTLLAYRGERAVGAAVCFVGFSTFAGRPSLNLHDFAVLPEYRGQGIGGRLLDEVERHAREAGCCKVTLEVHDSNDSAKALYRRRGFGPWTDPSWFVTQPL